jgi:polysaccharide deacetylase family protein (PEP-CTERM system associated)
MSLRILTFDIEEWFHILDHDATRDERSWEHFEPRLEKNLDRILELLEKHQQPATFFCLGWVSRKFPHLIKKIDAAGYEIASHSDMHQLAYEQTREEFTEDLKRSIGSLSELTGKKVRIYRTPGFSVTDRNPWVFEALAEQGIEVDCSVFPASRAHGGLESYASDRPSLIETKVGVLREFPINLFAGKIIFSGGGYFRLLPYPILSELFERSEYIMTYFHPRDFDPEQPMIPGLSPLRRFKSYYGLSGALKKLDRLLSSMNFVDLRTAETMIDWQKVPRIKF